MTALLIILAVLLLLFFFPFGVRVTYDQDGLRAWAKAAFFSFSVYPPKPKDPEKEKKKEEKKRRKEAKKEAKRAKRAKEHQPPEEKKGGNLAFLLSALPPVARAAGRLIRKIRVRELTLRVVWAADNPADAALGFGRANAALGFLWGLLSHSFRVRKKYLSCDVDYGSTSPTAILRATVTITLGRILVVAVPLLFRIIKLRTRQTLKAEEKTTKEALNHE